MQSSLGRTTPAPATRAPPRHRPRHPAIDAPRHRAALDIAARAAASIRAVLFDCDGVLVSSEHLSRQVARDVLLELHGVDVPLQDFVEFGGRGEALFLQGPAERRGVPAEQFDLERAKALFLDTYVERYASGPRAAELAYRGAAGLVEALRRDAGLRVGVASSAARRKLDANLRALLMGRRRREEEEDEGPGPEAYFDAVVALEPPVTRSKPHPDLFLRAMELASTRQPRLDPPLRPDECVVVEDAESGVKAALAAGMRCVGVATTHTSEELLAFGADLAVADVSALTVAAVLGLGGGGGARS